jgi:bifunctional non-homologous end joining protein LigD
MGLGKYRAKRDFAKTQEPAASRRKRPSGAPIFVVQKHAASTLHYDFRLESEGVLKSWAIPKGPSANPRDKRLAVMTEDHPLDYAGFEGSIPEGQYGGGTVLVWDRGTWTPEGSVRSGLRAGKLSFQLSGEKLHGAYSLVRLRGKDGQWLLIKRRDAQASEKKVTETKPLSVLSGRSIEEVTREVKPARKRAENQAVQRRPSAPGRRATRRSTSKHTTSLRTLLSLAEPELATLVKSPPSGDEWVHEMKFDGYRVLAASVDGEVRLISRNQNDWTERFGAVAKAVSSLKCGTVLLDGEVAIELADGRTSFQALQRALRDDTARLVYFVFDLLFLDENDLRGEALLTRKAALKKLLAHSSSVLRYSEHVEGLGADFFRHACQLRLEGAVSKRADSTYRPGRGKDWVKTKCGSRQELVIGGFTYLRNERKSNRIGALLLGVQDEERLVYAGRVGTGFMDAVRRELASKLGKLERSTSPFSEPLKAAAKGAHWVRPSLVAEVEFSEWTKDGRLRHPSFLGLRDDKTAVDVVREAPAESARAPKLTHPERVLFPGAKLTKQGLADYYTSIAARILPELEDRPVAYVRCPQGASRHCFFQRHPGKGIPATLRRVSIQEGTGENEYLVLDSLPDLLALVQLGALGLARR